MPDARLRSLIEPRRKRHSFGTEWELPQVAQICLRRFQASQICITQKLTSSMSFPFHFSAMDIYILLTSSESAEKFVTYLVANRENLSLMADRSMASI
jgi:hypothetical protein